VCKKNNKGQGGPTAARSAKLEILHISKQIKLCFNNTHAFSWIQEHDLAIFFICQISRPKIFLFFSISERASQIFFQDFFQSSCKFYTKRLIFVSRKQFASRIIWFYLVRAEVVLWWHCLIFFARHFA
jgi:hypothetical protein